MRNLNKFFWFFGKPAFLSFSLAMLCLVLIACKSKPVPQEEPPVSPPSAHLVFKSVEAETPEILTLLFELETKSHALFGSHAKLDSWQVEMDGENAGDAFTLDHLAAENFPLNAAVPVRINMDIAALAEKGLAPRDEYNLSLTTELALTGNSAKHEKLKAGSHAVFPGIMKPNFSISSIAIMKAELINTRFKVTLKIDNPNHFPVELSGFDYKLYGNGKNWAEGRNSNVLRVGGNSSLSGELFLLMNFINMDRRLLDQIVRLQDVNYRFEGEVQVTTGIAYLPKFNDSFDLSGYSRVLEN